MSGGQEQEQVFVAMEFIVLFVELKLLWNRYVGNKIVIIRHLGYDGDNILGLGNNYY